MKMPHWPLMRGYRDIELGLGRMEALLEQLGNPHLALPPVIHVAGTNGKGSTIAFMRAILEQAGYKVHVYTSPHLLEFNERIVVAGQPISDGHLHQVMEQCRIVAGDIPVTFFEGTTIGAFLAFSQTEADIVLLETGLGGRLDATNVISAPVATVITPISLDHMEYLGPTIGLIAREKAGIIKQHTPCVISAQTQDAFAVLDEIAEMKQAPLHAFEYDWGIERSDSGFIFNSENCTIALPPPALSGDHQMLNAATAIATLKILDGFTIPDEACAQGVLKATWPARLQHITQGALYSLLPEGVELWVDGAHNEGAAFTLANTLASWQTKPLHIICGMTRGRDSGKFLSYFKLIATDVTGIAVQTEPSSLSGEAIAQSAQQVGIPSFHSDTVQIAIEEIINRLDGQNARILCCGSLYLASDVLREG